MIGIFKTKDDSGKDRLFFECDDSSLLERMYKYASESLNSRVEQLSFSAKTKAKKVAQFELSVKSVNDNSEYDVITDGCDEEDRRYRQRKAIKGLNERLMKEGVVIFPETARETVVKEDNEEREERFVLSMVLEPTDGEDGSEMKPDTQGDIYSAEEVRKACHTWMEYHGQIDLQHNWNALSKTSVRILENYIAPCDMKIGDETVKKGSWMLGLRIADDKLWSAIKSGQIGAYSIGGTANKVPLKEV